MDIDLSFFNKERILITGGGGYLAQKIANYLINTGANVALLDVRFNDTNNYLQNKVIIDLLNKQELEDFCLSFQPTYIFHFAALLKRERDFNLYTNLYESNVRSTLNLLESLANVKYKNFIYSSTGEVYGLNSFPPFNENSVPYPASPYSLTKYMAELIIRNYSDLYSKPYMILRIFNFFSIDMPVRFFLNQLIYALKNNTVFQMTGGEQIRDYMSIEYLLTSILVIAKNPIITNDVINICSGRGYKIKDLANHLSQKFNKQHLIQIEALPYRKNEIFEMVGDNSKLKKLYNLGDDIDFYEYLDQIVIN